MPVKEKQKEKLQELLAELEEENELLGRVLSNRRQALNDTISSVDQKKDALQQVCRTCYCNFIVFCGTRFQISYICCTFSEEYCFFLFQCLAHMGTHEDSIKTFIKEYD